MVEEQKSRRVAPKSIRRLRYELREAERRLRFWLDRRFSGESPSKRLAALEVVNGLQRQLGMEPTKIEDYLPPVDPEPINRPGQYPKGKGG